MRFWVRSIITSILNRCLDLSAGLLVTSHPEWNPRAWSNQEIRKFGALFNGDVINVSASKDGDKEGGRYVDYFTKARTYTMSNYGHGEEGISGFQNEKILDLSKVYDRTIGDYDVVFSHTVIEHIDSVETAIDNLCSLSRDVVITVVPFLMGFHGRPDSYNDYWRYSPLALIRIFELRGFKTLYINWNDHHPLMNVYIVHIASKHPERYEGKFPGQKQPIVNIYGP